MTMAGIPEPCSHGRRQGFEPRALLARAMAQPDLATQTDVIAAAHAHAALAQAQIAWVTQTW